MSHIRKILIVSVTVILLILILIVFIIHSRKEKINYPEIFGLKDFSNIIQVEQDLGSPIKISEMDGNTVWYYNQFEIMFFHSGVFRTIGITGPDYYFKNKDCHVGCTAETVKQTFPESVLDRNNNLLYKDGKYYIRFLINNGIVDSIRIAMDDI